MLGYANGNTSPSTTASTGTTLQNAGADATSGALSGLSNYDPTQLNNADSLIANANKYVAGQDIVSQVNNAMLNARQTARDVTLPGIEQNAAISGNTNSSRTGIAQGLVERGLAEQAADLGSTLRSNAFKDGLTLASSNANANNTDTLGALSSAAGQGTNAANTGVSASTSGINQQTGLYNLANAAGTGEQSANQADLTNQNQQYQSGVSAPFASLQQLMSIIGTQNWGANTTGTKTVKTDPSVLSTIAGLLGTAGVLLPSKK
jgi:hypothetical protein